MCFESLHLVNENYKYGLFEEEWRRVEKNLCFLVTILSYYELVYALS